MCTNCHNGQVSIEEFLLLFGGNLDPDNRRVDLKALVPWESLLNIDTPNFNATTGAPWWLTLMTTMGIMMVAT